MWERSEAADVDYLFGSIYSIIFLHFRQQVNLATTFVIGFRKLDTETQLNIRGAGFLNTLQFVWARASRMAAWIEQEQHISWGKLELYIGYSNVEMWNSNIPSAE